MYDYCCTRCGWKGSRITLFAERDSLTCEVTTGTGAAAGSGASISLPAPLPVPQAGVTAAATVPTPRLCGGALVRSADLPVTAFTPYSWKP